MKTVKNASILALLTLSLATPAFGSDMPTEQQSSSWFRPSAWLSTLRTKASNIGSTASQFAQHTYDTYAPDIVQRGIGYAKSGISTAGEKLKNIANSRYAIPAALGLTGAAALIASRGGLPGVLRVPSRRYYGPKIWEYVPNSLKKDLEGLFSVTMTAAPALWSFLIALERAEESQKARETGPGQAPMQVSYSTYAVVAAVPALVSGLSLLIGDYLRIGYISPSMMRKAKQLAKNMAIVSSAFGGLYAFLDTIGFAEQTKLWEKKQQGMKEAREIIEAEEARVAGKTGEEEPLIDVLTSASTPATFAEQLSVLQAPTLTPTSYTSQELIPQLEPGTYPAMSSYPGTKIQPTTQYDPFAPLWSSAK